MNFRNRQTQVRAVSYTGSVNLTGESGGENPGTPTKRQNLDNLIVSEFRYLMFHVFSIAEMGFLNSPVKIGCGNPSFIGFWMADFQLT